MSTFTEDQQNKIREFFKDREIPTGLGSAEAACSIAAINLALTGELTDNIPDCMSPVIGRWIIICQDSMSSEMRNSNEWRNLLPLAAGTGRDHEKERLQIILNWMWETVLPYLQPIADKYNFGEAWRTMCNEKTADAAADAAYTTADAAYTTAYAAYTTAYTTADAAYTTAYAAYTAAYAAAAAYAAYTAADAARADADAWQQFNPTKLLQQLIEVS